MVRFRCLLLALRRPTFRLCTVVPRIGTKTPYNNNSAPPTNAPRAPSIRNHATAYVARAVGKFQIRA